MTRRTLLRIVQTVMWCIGGLLGLAVLLHFALPGAYQTFKDLIPLMLAIPVAYLGYCFQERSSFNRELRLLWVQLIQAQQAARDYTYSKQCSYEEYGLALSRLSVAIELIRSLFRNYSERDGESGIYPYDSYKEIYKVVRELGYGEALSHEAKSAARREIERLWKQFRGEFLLEFDRDAPQSAPSAVERAEARARDND